jgi:hypothetical protein
MSDTLKVPGQEPKRDLSGTTVHIAEYDRGTFQVVHRWPVDEYVYKTDATTARKIVVGLLDTLFPDPAHAGSRPLTEQDLSAIRLSVAEQLGVLASQPITQN